MASESESLQNAETVAAPVSALHALGKTPVAGDSAADPGRRSGVRSSGAIEAAARGLVRLVEGSTPHLSGETSDLLQRRLLISAALFFTGYLVFLIRGLLFWRSTYENGGEPVFYLQLVAMVIAGATALWLARARDLSMTTLRIVEWTVFGSTAAFFTLITRHRLDVAANLADGAHLPVVVGPWLLLIFIYALFIPNTWRRALRFLGPVALLPIGVILFQRAFCHGFQGCLAKGGYGDYVTEQGLQMLFVLLIAVVGVHSINTLRTQAFAAKQLGQYRLKQRIGAGGMGEVYLAEHQMMKRPCAIKVIRPEKAGDPKTLARFEREVRSTAKLSHWNSIDIYDYGNTEDGTFYYVMEYLPGHNVGELVEQGGPLPPARVVYLMDQVCRALSEAHGIGLVHRDIKPANIFCAYRGGEFDVAKLLDFGLAKPTVDAATETQHVALTADGAITGSPLFMSPEQATGESEADARSDIYSLGCVLYYLFTGKPPYPYEQAVKVIVAHASEEVLPPRRHNASLPAGLEEVVMRCLEKDPEDRFQTVEQLRDALLEAPLEDAWSAEMASDWWQCNGCPERKAMAAAAVEAAAV